MLLCSRRDRRCLLVGRRQGRHLSAADEAKYGPALAPGRPGAGAIPGGKGWQRLTTRSWQLPRLHALSVLLEEFERVLFECACKTFDGRQEWIALAALNQAHKGDRDARKVGERLLSEPVLLTQELQVARYDCFDGHGSLPNRARRRRSDVERARVPRPRPAPADCPASIASAATRWRQLTNTTNSDELRVAKRKLAPGSSCAMQAPSHWAPVVGPHSWLEGSSKG